MTYGSIGLMGHIIEGVAKGAQEQTKAIQKASEVASLMGSAIQQLTATAQFSARGAVEAAEAARAGAKTVQATIVSIQTIQQQVGGAAQKIREMGERSEQIDEIVETIEEIASQTNLLALNAAIEAARVESKGEKTVENILQQHLLGVVSLVADMLATGRELDSKILSDLARQARVEAFTIADSDGVIFASNDPGSVGFRFSEDPRQESSIFRQLLNQRDGIVIRPILERDQDGKPYIYVGVSRRDRPGIVQAGIAGDLVYRLGGYSRGFAVLAVEIRKLAEHAKEATKKINVLISGIQKSVAEAMVMMEDGTRKIESGSVQAAQAGNSLTAILETSEAVRGQVEEIVAAIQHMSKSSNELTKVMQAVNTVTEENNTATMALASGSNEVTRSAENIASISEENSAAVEEVSAAAEEVSAQVEQVSASAASLMNMAQELQQVISRFKLNIVSFQSQA
jgi:methyl-accepting chemotaxis protein